jgi:hypothetical protein
MSICRWLWRLCEHQTGFIVKEQHCTVIGTYYYLHSLSFNLVGEEVNSTRKSPLWIRLVSNLRPTDQEPSTSALNHQVSCQYWISNCPDFFKHLTLEDFIVTKSKNLGRSAAIIWAEVPDDRGREGLKIGAYDWLRFYFWWNIFEVRFEVLTVVKVIMMWVVMPCELVVDTRDSEKQCIYLQGWNQGFWEVNSLYRVRRSKLSGNWPVRIRFL